MTTSYLGDLENKNLGKIARRQKIWRGKDIDLAKDINSKDLPAIKSLIDLGYVNPNGTLTRKGQEYYDEYLKNVKYENVTKPVTIKLTKEQVEGTSLKEGQEIEVQLEESLANHKFKDNKDLYWLAISHINGATSRESVLTSFDDRKTMNDFVRYVNNSALLKVLEVLPKGSKPKSIRYMNDYNIGDVIDTLHINDKNDFNEMYAKVLKAVTNNPRKLNPKNNDVSWD